MTRHITIALLVTALAGCGTSSTARIEDTPSTLRIDEKRVLDFCMRALARRNAMILETPVKGYGYPRLPARICQADGTVDPNNLVFFKATFVRHPAELRQAHREEIVVEFLVKNTMQVVVAKPPTTTADRVRFDTLRIAYAPGSSPETASFSVPSYGLTSGNAY